MLTKREEYLVKIAVASALKAVLEAVDLSHNSMIEYRLRNPNKPAEHDNYYDPHRQFEELVTALGQEVESRVHYDDDISVHGSSADLV